MISSRKEEEKGSSNYPHHPPSSSSSGLSSWARLKDPRIVRVSRAFGGKDRHSKVCTVRGLRDRRVRLSVPTAIQLYDLQDRLGLNQPSKVVDWLLNAAKNEIDELPPLQIPSGSNLMEDHNLKSLILANSTKQLVEPNPPNWFNQRQQQQHQQQQQEFMRWGDSSNLSLAQSGMHEEDDHDVQNYNVLPFVVPSTQVLLYQPHPHPHINSQSYLAESTETIRLSQNRIGRDFEPWFHLSTTPPQDHPNKNNINESETTVQPETNWPRL